MAKEKSLEAVHKEALERFNSVWNAEKDQRRLAIEDMRFAHAEDGQWDEQAIEKRKDRPRYTINRIAGAIDQVVGDQRQNRTQIKVRSVSGGTDDVAKVEAGLIRNIESVSDADSIYDAAFDEVVTGGYGGWRVLTKFTESNPFEQEVVIAPIKSAASSLFLDNSAQKYDKSDAMWGFYVESMTLEKFKNQYPDATIVDFSSELYHSSSCKEWFRDNQVMVAEYWTVDMVPTEIALLSDGRIIDMEEEKAVLDELADNGVEIIKQRKTTKRKVRSYQINGAEVLKGPMDWAGKYIPLVPVFGRTFNIEGKDFVRGLVRNAKDPQRIFNYATSTAIETTALTPKDPYWITAEQAKGHEARLKTFNTRNSPFMLYNTDPKSPGPPQRTGAPQVQTALIQQVTQAADDIHATTGLFAPAMGNAPQLLSEKSVLAQSEKGDRGVYVFESNKNKSIAFTGEILIDLLPRIYDTQRVVTVLNFDGTTENVTINEQALNEFNQPILDEETGEQVIVNDLGRGVYESYVEAGPAYKTMREESAQQLIELATGSPVFEQMATDLIAKNLGILESEELTKRVRKFMIMNGTAEPTEDEIKELGLDQPQQPDPTQVAVVENLQMQSANLAADIKKKEAEADAKSIDSQVKVANLTAQDEEREQRFELELQRMQQNFTLALKEQQRKSEESIIAMQKQQAETLEILRQATGADAIINQHTIEAYDQTAENLNQDLQ